MYPTRKLTPEQEEVYNLLKERVNPTYSVERIIEIFRKTELRELLEESEKLPPHLICEDKGLSRRLTRIATALARKGGLRGD